MRRKMLKWSDCVDIMHCNHYICCADVAVTKQASEQSRRLHQLGESIHSEEMPIDRRGQAVTLFEANHLNDFRIECSSGQSTTGQRERY